MRRKNYHNAKVKMQQHKVIVTNTFDYFVKCRHASEEFKNCKEKKYFAPENPSKCSIRRSKIKIVTLPFGEDTPSPNLTSQHRRRASM